MFRKSTGACVPSSATAAMCVLWLLVAVLGCGLARAQDEVASSVDDHRMDWWRDARFGMFIHWGLYAIPAGEWNGQARYAEWIRHSAQIPIETYDKYVEQFNPVEFDADAWVRLAKRAGMKYIVITSKHHDGFALFDSAVSEFDVMATPFGRDILKELSEACRRHGIRMCWYHSIMDWHHPDYLPRRPWEIETRPVGDADFDRYVKYLRAQVSELLTNYGNIGVMWFDGEWESTWSHEYGQPLYDLCRELQPNIIVNDRVDTGRQGHSGIVKAERAGDFGTPEQNIPPTGLPGVDWETCMTMNDHWGFNKADSNFKSTRELIRKLVDIASKNGNYLLNVGPRADGTFPAESIERLEQIGAWMDVNGESIYGTTASPFSHLTWGRCTTKIDGDDATLFLHVFDWPADGVLIVPGLGNDAKHAALLADRGSALSIERVESDVRITVPKEAPDEICSVIALHVAGRPIVYEAPRIEAAADQFVRPLRVTVETGSDALHACYTLDGSDPTDDSPEYDEPITVSDTTTVSVRSYHEGRAVSSVTRRTFTKAKPTAAKNIANTQPGLVCDKYQGDWNELPDFDALAPTESIVAENIGLHAERGAEYFGRRLTGYLNVPSNDVYRFALTDDDGARLLIDGAVVVDNDGLHSAITRQGDAALAVGLHEIRVEYFNKTGNVALSLEWAALGAELKPVGTGELFHVR